MAAVECWSASDNSAALTLVRVLRERVGGVVGVSTASDHIGDIQSWGSAAMDNVRLVVAVFLELRLGRQSWKYWSPEKASAKRENPPGGKDENGPHPSLAADCISFRTEAGKRDISTPTAEILQNELTSAELGSIQRLLEEGLRATQTHVVRTVPVGPGAVRKKRVVLLDVDPRLVELALEGFELVAGDGPARCHPHPSADQGGCK